MLSARKDHKPFRKALSKGSRLERFMWQCIQVRDIRINLTLVWIERQIQLCLDLCLYSSWKAHTYSLAQSAKRT